MYLYGNTRDRSGRRATPTLLARFVGLLSALALALGGCALLRDGLEAPGVSLVEIRPLQMGVLEQRFAVKLRVQNANAVPLPISGLRYRLEVDGRDFGRGVSSRALRIPAYGEEVVELELSTNMLSMLDKLRRWSRNPPDAIPYAIQGELKLDDRVRPFPFRREGTVPFAAPGTSP